MSVVVDFINVIVPVSVLEAKYPGGLIGYRNAVPNGTFCCDGVLACHGYMNQYDVEKWLAHLTDVGLEIERDGRYVDVAVTDLFRMGVTARQPTWLCRSEDGGFHHADHPPGNLVSFVLRKSQ